MTANAELDVLLCERLVERGASGDDQALRELVELLWRFWIDAVSKSRSMGPLARSEDHVHNVVAKLVAKIGRSGGGGVRLYPPWRAQNPDKTFVDWIRIVTANAVRSYVRGELGPRTTEDGVSVKRLLNEFSLSPAAAELGIRPPITLAQTARELLEFARLRLPEAQLRALSLWLEGGVFEEIEAALSISAGEGQKLVRAAIGTLRRHVAAKIVGQ